MKEKVLAISIIFMLTIPLIYANQDKPHKYTPLPTEEDIRVQKAIERIDYWTTFLIKINPPYAWGKAGTLGGDCSGQVWWIYSMAGLPFHRTTSYLMYSGAWPGYISKTWEDARRPDLVFFTMEPHRPFGHVGIVRFRSDYPPELLFAEASTKKGFSETIMTPTSYHGKKFKAIKIVDLSICKNNNSLKK